MKKILALLMAFALSTGFINTAYGGYTVKKEPAYNMAQSFYSSVGKVSENSRWALIDSSGKRITEYRWDALGDVTSDYIPAMVSNMWGYISPSGVSLIPYQFISAGEFNSGIAHVVMSGNIHAYINTNGSVQFYSPFSYSFDLKEGMICGIRDGLYGYCDNKGNIIIEPRFTYGFDFSDGYAAVQKDGKWGYITKNGSFAIAPEYEYAADFSDGFAVCKKSSGYGIIDDAGNEVTSFDYSYIGIPDDRGRYPVKRGGQSGYIDTNGNWLITTDYDFCYTFTEGYARVFKDNLWGYIDEYGTEIVPPTFADCGEVRHGMAPFSYDGVTYGYLTLTNGSITPVAPTPVIKPVNPADDLLSLDELAATGELLPDNPKMGTISMKIDSRYALKESGGKVLVAAPALINGVTMVPLRDAVEFLGGKVEWFAETQRILITYKTKKVQLYIDSKICFVNGMSTAVAQAPMLINGVTMIPLRGVAEFLSCKVEWIGETQNIYIEY